MGTTDAQRAIRNAYMENPNLCAECGEGILPRAGRKLAETRRKKFCSRSCAARFNNQLSVAPKRQRKPTRCVECGNDFVTPQRSSARVYCPSCWSEKQKKFLLSKKNSVTRRAIYAHARSSVSDRPRSCANCGYDKHVETCHIRPISDFPDDASIQQINDPENLIILCPNCHWELDNGHLTL